MHKAWSFFDYLLWLVANGSDEELADFFAQPQQARLNYRHTALLYTDQIPVWLKVEAGKPWSVKGSWLPFELDSTRDGLAGLAPNDWLPQWLPALPVWRLRGLPSWRTCLRRSPARALAATSIGALAMQMPHVGASHCWPDRWPRATSTLTAPPQAG